MAEGRFFYAGPQPLDEPTSGRCYNLTIQDGKRKISPAGQPAVLSRRGYTEGVPADGDPRRHLLPWHLLRSRLIVPFGP